jgi:hypothetical protein
MAFSFAQKRLREGEERGHCTDDNALPPPPFRRRQRFVAAACICAAGCGGARTE